MIDFVVFCGFFVVFLCFFCCFCWFFEGFLLFLAKNNKKPSKNQLFHETKHEKVGFLKVFGCFFQKTAKNLQKTNKNSKKTTKKPQKNHKKPQNQSSTPPSPPEPLVLEPIFLIHIALQSQSWTRRHLKVPG